MRRLLLAGTKVTGSGFSSLSGWTELRDLAAKKSDEKFAAEANAALTRLQ